MFPAGLYFERIEHVPWKYNVIVNGASLIATERTATKMDAL
jgi:hypothetical protein